jgi:hypothetical protein
MANATTQCNERLNFKDFLNVSRETAMRPRTRDVVRMLATLRHAAHCRTLRAANARKAIDEHQDNPADADEDADDTGERVDRHVLPNRSH